MPLRHCHCPSDGEDGEDGGPSVFLPLFCTRLITASGQDKHILAHPSRDAVDLHSRPRSAGTVVAAVSSFRGRVPWCNFVQPQRRLRRDGGIHICGGGGRRPLEGRQWWQWQSAGMPQRATGNTPMGNGIRYVGEGSLIADVLRRHFCFLSLQPSGDRPVLFSSVPLADAHLSLRRENYLLTAS